MYFVMIQKIVRTQSTFRLKMLGLGVFNRRTCLKIDQRTPRDLKS